MKNSKIEWTDHTFNPWIGCSKVSLGCVFCYAEAQDHRWGHDSWGPGKPRRRTSADYWKQPLKWDRNYENAVLRAGLQGDAEIKHQIAEGLLPLPRPRVFCASLADWLDDEVPIEWLADLLDLIRRTPNLDWLLLTKRPQNWDERVGAACSWMSPLGPYSDTKKWLYRWLGGLGRENHVPPVNVWIGTTVEDQTRADERIPHLLKIPAKVRFLSCEPLLGPVDLRDVPNEGFGEGEPHYDSLLGRAYDSYGDGTNGPRIDWVICGGESGPKARPMHPHWARSLRDQCAEAGVPFLFKQWGEWTPGENLTRGGRLNCAVFAGDRWDFYTQTDKQSENCHADDSPDVYRVGKTASGRLLDGKEHNEFPEVRHA